MGNFFEFARDSFGSFLDLSSRPNFNTEYVKYLEQQSIDEAIQDYWLEVGACLWFAVNKFEEENAEEIQAYFEKQETTSSK